MHKLDKYLKIFKNEKNDELYRLLQFRLKEIEAQEGKNKKYEYEVKRRRGMRHIKV